MALVEPVIRPPAEADSFLLQVTLGCSADHCSFCGAYKAKPFSAKDPQEIFSDIERFARRYPGTRRVFLMDGDALVLSNRKHTQRPDHCFDHTACRLISPKLASPLIPVEPCLYALINFPKKIEFFIETITEEEYI